MSPLPPERTSRFVEGAQWRRTLVYAATAIVVIYAAVMAVRLAQPPSANSGVRVERAPGYHGASNVDPGKVFWDPNTGKAFVEMNLGDGQVKRYRVEANNGKWSVYNEDDSGP